VSALLLVTLVAYLNIWGVPGWLLPRVTSALSDGDMAPEVGGARLDLVSGLVLEDVALYRRGVMGGPLLKARRVVIGRHPLAVIAPVEFPLRITVSDGYVAWKDARRIRPCDTRPMKSEIPVLLDLKSTVVEGVPVEHLRGSLLAGPDGWSLTELSATVSNGPYRGTLEGRLSCRGPRNEIRGKLVSRLNPLALAPVFDACDLPSLTEIAAQFAFASVPPTLDLDINAVGTGTLQRFDVNGTMALGMCRFRGVDVNQADGRLSVRADSATSLVTVGPLRVMRADGFVSGSFTVDSAKALVDFDAESTIDPKALLQMIGVLTNGVMDTWTFRGPVRVSGRGRTGYLDYSHTDFLCRVHGWDMGIKRVVAEECTFDVRMTGRTNRIENVRARLHGGELAGEATFVLPDGPDTNGSYRIAGSLRNGDFAAFTKALDILGDQGQKSRYSVNVDVSGRLDDMGATALGAGAFHVRDGRIFSLPVFGGLSSVLARIVPGLDFIMRQSDAKSEFTVKNGRVSSEKVAIEGDVLSLSGDGSCGLDGSLSFDIRVQLMKEHTLVAKILRTITWPISKLFELRLRGTASDPRWFPVNFASDPGPAKAPPPVGEEAAP
jgi:hypothetical protein